MNQPTELTLAESLKKVSFIPQKAPYKMRLNVPFAEKDRAKAMGAKWESSVKAWFIPADAELSKFRQWLPK